MNARAVCAIGAALFLGCYMEVEVQAAPLLPGGALLTPAEPDPIGGVVVGGGVPQIFSSGPGVGHYSGELTTTVIKDDPSNPFANIGDPNPLNHGLTFVYQIHNDATSATSLERMTNLDFSGFSTDVSYQVPAAGVVPTSIDRSFGPGGILGWDFTGAPEGLGRVAPGSSTALLVVQTNASQFVPINANLIDGSTALASSLGPDVSTVIFPEPASLFVLAMGGLVCVRRRRQ